MPLRGVPTNCLCIRCQGNKRDDKVEVLLDLRGKTICRDCRKIDVAFTASMDKEWVLDHSQFEGAHIDPYTDETVYRTPKNYPPTPAVAQAWHKAAVAMAAHRARAIETA